MERRTCLYLCAPYLLIEIRRRYSKPAYLCANRLLHIAGRPRGTRPRPALALRPGRSRNAQQLHEGTSTPTALRRTWYISSHSLSILLKSGVGRRGTAELYRGNPRRGTKGDITPVMSRAHYCSSPAQCIAKTYGDLVNRMTVWLGRMDTSSVVLKP
ncbi:hypothetical protein GY45DRAFT_367718 [Cubamyces sp. BRFM 1775]|nr:hypothetical protein GY45DRAFT_367718 [Cubamyces sp. BRFM 1775]